MTDNVLVHRFYQHPTVIMTYAHHVPFVVGYKPQQARQQVEPKYALADERRMDGTCSWVRTREGKTKALLDSCSHRAPFFKILFYK